ncbi:hypothetical protein CTA1_3976 [Colletotrichum tanaceti]|uniref:Uncharacterized protein n=1 Tax=Colletotrichum tanaceti TaxID=1306861 RepID=A0A4U6XKC8_9PEZI|nr:hypothetical protein CTA1_3976 [Colletotrichum tanaceti]
MPPCNLPVPDAISCASQRGLSHSVPRVVAVLAVVRVATVALTSLVILVPSIVLAPLAVALVVPLALVLLRVVLLVRLRRLVLVGPILLVRLVLLVLVGSVLLVRRGIVRLLKRPLPAILLVRRRRSVVPALGGPRLVTTTRPVELRAGRRRTDADVLVADVVRHVDLDLGEVLLHLLLDNVLHKDPALALKLAVAAVDDAEDALAQRLLYLADEAADLVEQLDLDVVPEAAVRVAAGVAVELRVERVPAEDPLERPLEGVWQELKELLLDATEDLAELESYFPVHLGEAGAELVADDLGEAAAAAVPVAAVAVADSAGALLGALLVAEEAAEALDQVLDLVLDLTLDAVAEVARAGVAAQPALDVVQSDASELLGDGRVLLPQLEADLLLDLWADDAGLLFRVSGGVLDGVAEHAKEAVKLEALSAGALVLFKVVLNDVDGRREEAFGTGEGVGVADAARLGLGTVTAALGEVEDVSQVVAGLVRNHAEAARELADLVGEGQRLDPVRVRGRVVQAS